MYNFTVFDTCRNILFIFFIIITCDMDFHTDRITQITLILILNNYFDVNLHHTIHNHH